MTATTSQFPIPLCPAYLEAARHVGIDLISCLCNIDDVKDVLGALKAKNPNVGQGEEVADDLYRLCVRIRDQYYSQFRY